MKSFFELSEKIKNEGMAPQAYTGAIGGIQPAPIQLQGQEGQEDQGEEGQGQESAKKAIDDELEILKIQAQNSPNDEMIKKQISELEQQIERMKRPQQQEQPQLSQEQPSDPGSKDPSQQMPQPMQ